MAIRGSCLCGAVQFEVDEFSGPFEICHCNRCRKTTGATGMPAIGVKKSDFRFVAGDELVKSYAAPILTRAPAYESYFCGVCGSPVPAPEPNEEFLEIPAGLLDDDPEIKPDKHIFVELVPAWDAITDRLVQLDAVALRKHRAAEGD